MRIRRTLPGDANAPRIARDALRDLSPQLPAPTTGDLRVLVSELVTNAVKHAGLREGEAIALDVRTSSERAEVTVRYPEHSGFEQFAPHQTGWGFYLVDRISDHWSIVEADGELLAWCEVNFSRNEAA